MGAEPILASFYARFRHPHRLLCNPKKRAEKRDDEKRAKKLYVWTGLNTSSDLRQHRLHRRYWHNNCLNNGQGRKNTTCKQATSERIWYLWPTLDPPLILNHSYRIISIINLCQCMGWRFRIGKVLFTLTATTTFGLQIACHTNAPFVAMISICDVNIWRCQNNKTDEEIKRIINSRWWHLCSDPCMSEIHCNYIDIPTVNIRGPSFHNITMNFYDS